MGVMLKSLYIHNFKSFWHSNFEFGKVNCLIAPNNAGKSNLVEVLEFLNDLLYLNPLQAINKIGFKKIKNFHYHENEVKLEALFTVEERTQVNDECFDYSIELLHDFTFDIETKQYNIDIKIVGKVKSIAIEKRDINVISREKDEEVDFDALISNYRSYSDSLDKKSYRNFELSINKNTLYYNIKTQYDSTKEMVERLFNLQVESENKLKIPISFQFIFGRSSLFSSHYFHAHTIKRTQNVGYAYLLEDGTNLTDFLGLIPKERLENISTSMIGEVELINDIEIRENFTTDLIFKEEINGKVYDVGLFDVSDGTVHFIAIMTALIGISDAIGLVIEEPERHMHMKVLYYILGSMRDSNKQIFFTTHSMELVQQLELDEVLFMFRDYDGNTQGQRAIDTPHIKDFMKRYKNDLVALIEMGIVGEYEE